MKAAALVLDMAPEAGDLAETMLKMKTLTKKFQYFFFLKEGELFYRIDEKNLAQKDLKKYFNALNLSKYYLIISP